MQLCNETIGQVLDRVAHTHANALAVCDPDRLLTYRELNTHVSGLAGALLAKGIRRGDHVAIWARETVQTVICFYALWKIGAVVVPLCTSFTPAELDYCMEKADVSWILTGTAHKGGTFEQVQPQLQHQLPRICVEDFSQLELLEKESVSQAVLEECCGAVCVEDPDMILFTSGSTGASKPVLTSHYARVNVAHEQAWALGATDQDRFCSVLPMYHCFSITASVLAALVVGAAVCIPKDTHSNTILSFVEKHRCTILSGVPTLFSAMLQRLERTSYDISSLRTGFIGGSSYAKELFVRICQQMNMTLIPSLGQSEATAGLTAGSLEDSLEVRATTIGKFFPLLEGSIRSPQTNEALPCGQVGEICIRGVGVMEGYYRQPEVTAKVIDQEGWLHTGDLGKMDEQGIVTFEGRLKELIIRGGENISPLEIEDILSRDPRIHQVKVVGVPSKHYVEEVCACVVATESITADEVRSLVQASAAYYKVPSYVEFFTEFPLTSTGKIDGKVIRAQVIQKLNLEA